VDGTLADVRPSQFSAIPPGGHFLIGALAGAADPADPHYDPARHFLGLIDEVRVYQRALSASEIATHARVRRPAVEMSAPSSPCPAGTPFAPLACA
jgi:hypothetical protein